MKKLYTIFCFFFLLVSLSYADYTSVHKPYGGVCNQYDTEENRNEDTFTYLISLRFYTENEFKLFIPPGSMEIMKSFSKQYEGYEIGYVEKYQTPPECEFCDKPYHDIPFTPNNKYQIFSMANLKNNEAYSENQGGTSYFMSNFGNLGYDYKVNGIQEKDAGWLYIKRIGIDAEKKRSTQTFFFSIKVKSKTYFDWLDRIKANNDPICQGGEVVNVCSRDHLEYCTNETSCAAKAGYYYDNDNDGKKTCNAEKPCNNIDECNSNSNFGEKECEMSGFYYYGNSCNEKSPCDGFYEENGHIDNPYCDSSACKNAGFYYYEDACFIDPACTSTENCSKDNCTYEASGEGFYYYDSDNDSIGECNDNPQSPPPNSNDCSNDPSKCSEAECRENPNYKWCSSANTCIVNWEDCVGENSNNNGGDDSNNNNNGSSDNTNCYYFFGIGICSGGDDNSNNSNVCDSNHPVNCLTQASCEDTGNVWCDGVCYDKNNIPESCRECDSNHLEFCDTETKCQEKNLIWCENKCYADEGSVPNTCKPCATDNPDGCKDKESCKENGHIWFASDYNGFPVMKCIARDADFLPHLIDNKINVISKTSNKNLDMIKRYAFPLFVGDNLIDGIINNGDILDIRARLFPIDEPYDLYLAMVYGDNLPMFFTKDGNTWKINGDAVPFMKNITLEDYTEYKSGAKFDFCELLKSVGWDKDFSIWSLAFPASENYLDNMQGLIARYKEQEKSSISYYLLKNECYYGYSDSGLCDYMHPYNCKDKESCEKFGGNGFVWCQNECIVSKSGTCD